MKRQIALLLLPVGLVIFFLTFGHMTIAAPGDLDPTFGNGGKIIDGVAGGRLEAVAIQLDGKIVVAGGAGLYSAPTVARYNSDGSPDAIFGGGDGHVQVACDQYAEHVDVALQQDGKIVGACFENSVGNGSSLFRLDNNGILDKSFGNNGYVFPQIDPWSVAIQPDGKIIYTGSSVCRLNSEGSYDTSFGSGGCVSVAPINFSESIVELDGKIVAAGTSYFNSSNLDFAIVRFTSTGSLDTTFDNDGIATTDLGGLDYATSVSLQPDGKILASGVSHDGQGGPLALVRYNADGSLDPTFDTDGRVLTPTGGNANSVAIQTDGRILAATTIDAGADRGPDFSLLRYNPNGSVDTTFGDGTGVVFVDFFNASKDRANAMALDGQGRAVVVGESNGAFALARFQLASNGSPTPTPTPTPTPSPTPGLPTTITVINTNDSGAGSLRQAIADAAPGGTIDFSGDISGGTITLTSGQLVVDKNLTIQGPGASLLSISGNNHLRSFGIESGATVTLDGMTIKDGNTRAFGDDGGGIYNSGTLTVNNSTISGNRGRAGGGIINDSNGTLTLANSIVKGNYADESGGIHNNGILTVNNSTVADNFSETAGGGISNYYGTVTINGSSFSGNTADSYGGGISNAGSLTITGSAVSGNTANSGGGISNGGTLTVTNSTILDNRASKGGGIINFDRLTVTNSTISNNFAGAGGGIWNNSVLVVSNSTISGNTSGDSGGGIWSFNSLTVNNSTVSGNTAYYGGGIAVDGDTGGYGVGLVLNSSTVSGNTGDGIFVYRSSTSINNSTVSGNTGDGINVINDTVLSETLHVGNSTITGNTGLGIFCGVAGGLTNSIVASNSGGDIGAVIETASHNLIGDAASSGGIQNGVNGNIVGVSPLLGPLRNNGGPTKTHALLTGSPAVNAGNNCVLTANGCGNDNPALPTDQRGFPRVGTVDIGAFERQNAEISSTAPFDYDADGKSDLSVWRPSNGTWYVARSGLGDMYVQPWGLNGDQIVPADYDGDGKTDLAVRRPTDNNFYILNSSNNSVEVRNFGISGDVALPSDYNGDGKADVAVWRPSNGTWYLSLSGSGIFYVMPWGFATDKPVPGDYDGDGKTDLAVFRPTEGRWYVFNTVNGSINTTDFGINGDRPVQADYSGDGKTDFAVYRPSNNTWYRSHTNDGTFNVSQWGLPGDFPVPGDYDGDGKTDVAVFRPSNGTWYVLKSTSGVFTQAFGITGDLPTPNAFVY